MRQDLRRLPLLFGLVLCLGSFLARAAERPALFHTPPPVARPGEPLVVEGMLVRGDKVDKLLLHFRGPNQPFQTVPMDSVYGDLFRGTIPSDKVSTPGIEYYVDGTMDDGSRVTLFMNDSRPARVLVVPGARVPKPKEPPPAETPPAEKAPAEAKPPAEKAPAEAKSAEKAPAEAKPAEKAPAEAKPAEKAPAGGKSSAEKAPAEAKPAEKAPAEAKPAEKAPPAETKAERTPAEQKPPPEPPAEPRTSERGSEGKSSDKRSKDRRSSESKSDRRSAESRSSERNLEDLSEQESEPRPLDRRSDRRSSGGKSKSSERLPEEPKSSERGAEMKPFELAPAEEKAPLVSRRGTPESKSERKPEPPAEPPAREPPPERAEPAPERRKPATELEEELSLYSAEDRSGIAPRQEPRAAQAPEQTTSVSHAEMLAMGARSVYDVLSLMPGISISRDVAGFYRTGVRGSRSDPQVLFLLNGHVLNNFYDGKALANLPVENLERIEVILGPGPAQYGNGAFDAVVNIVTRREEGLQAAVSGGSFLTFDGHLTAMKPLGALKVFGDLDVLRQDGSKRTVNKDSLDLETLSQGYREDPLDPAGTTQDDRLLVNAGAGFVYESEGVGKLALSTRFIGEDRGALVGLFDTLGTGSRLKWLVFGADLSYELVLAPKAVGHAHFTFDDQSTDRVYQISPGALDRGDEGPSIPGFTTAESLETAAPDQIFPKGLREGFRVGVRTFGLELGGDVALAGSNQLTVGLSAQEQVVYGFEHVTNYYKADNGTLRRNDSDDTLKQPKDVPNLVETAPSALSRLTLALYAQDRWTLLPNLTATFGIRVEAIQLPTAVNGQFTPQTALQPSFQPRVGVAYALTPALVLKGSYSRASRAPTVQELTEAVPDNDFDRGRVAGNPGLKSPTVDLVELGADLVQVSGESRVRLRGDVFYENVTNAIAAVDTTGNLVPLTNRNRVTVLGAEGEARLEVSRRTRAWLNASFFRAEDADARSGFRLLTDTPQARLNSGLSMPIGEWLNFDLAIEIGAERRNNSRSSLEALRRFRLPAYSLVTAQLRTETLADHFTFALVAHNVFQTDLADDPYRPDRMPSGVPREGFSAFLTMRISL